VKPDFCVENPDVLCESLSIGLPYSIYGVHGLPNEVVGQNIAERQGTVLKILASEKSDLLTQPSLVRKSHP
jgi:hypothetical protein